MDAGIEGFGKCHEEALAVLSFHFEPNPGVNESVLSELKEWGMVESKDSLWKIKFTEPLAKLN